MTKNIYSYPVKITSSVKIDSISSPAHTGRLKNAVDFIVPLETQIFAACNGAVIDVKHDSDIGEDEEKYDKNGNYIEIEHSYGEYSIYEHIRKYGSKVKVGDKVKRGQIIGYSGKTGWMGGLGPHVHFDVHRYTGNGPEDYESLNIEWSIPLKG